MLKKETLLITINSLRSGGAERVVTQLLGQLTKEFEIHFALYSPIIEFDIPEEVKIFNLNQPEDESAAKMLFKLPAMAKRLARYCKKNNIVYSVAFLNRPCYINALMRKFYGYKGRMVMCERTYQSGMLSTKSWLTRFMTRLLIPPAYNISDLVLANAEAMKQDLINTMQVRKQIAVIYNPVDIPLIEQKIAVPVSFNRKPGKFYFIAIGNFRKEKNFPLLIEAFNTIKDQSCQLILVGDGPDKIKMEQMVADAGTSNRVTFTGMERNPYKWMKLADAFVLSSDVEGFPNVLLEALAAGKPCISTDCLSGPREMIAPNSGAAGTLREDWEEFPFGLLVKIKNPNALASAMMKISQDSVLRERLSENGKLRAKQFSLPLIANQYADAFAGRGSFENKGY